MAGKGQTLTDRKGEREIIYLPYAWAVMADYLLLIAEGEQKTVRKNERQNKRRLKIN